MVTDPSGIVTNLSRVFMAVALVAETSAVVESDVFAALGNATIGDGELFKHAAVNSMSLADTAYNGVDVVNLSATRHAGRVAAMSAEAGRAFQWATLLTACPCCSSPAPLST